MTRAVICVSHQAGAGGRELAAAVAERLGYRYVDEEVIAHAAERENISVAELADVEERKSFLARLMIDFGRSGATPYAPGLVPPAWHDVPATDRLRSAIVNAIEEIAAAGRVVIVSHAASHALTGVGVLRVLVVAPGSVRQGRLAEDGAENPAKALSASDAGRREYLKRFYSIDHESPDQYDLVVNTGQIAPAAFAPLVVSAAEL